MFLGVKNIPPSPLYLFPDLMDLNLRLHRTFSLNNRVLLYKLLIYDALYGIIITKQDARLITVVLNEIIKYHFDACIKDKYELPECRKEGYVLILDNGKKVVFRAQDNYYEIFLREKFFYDNINRKYDKICPDVYVVDGTLKLYDKPYQISEYIEGKSVDRYLVDDNICEKEKRSIYYKIGETIAHINNIEISSEHPYVSNRNSCIDFFACKIEDQLNRIIKNNLVTEAEISAILAKMKEKNVRHSFSFLHRDFRPMNMILKDDKIFVIDAETCDFGDPLNELAFIRLEWTYWDMFDVVMEGYKSVFNIDIENELVDFYILECLGETLDMHYNYNCSNRLTSYFVKMFNRIKDKILSNESPLINK